jgi:hypothetical protein
MVIPAKIVTVTFGLLAVLCASAGVCADIQADGPITHIRPYRIDDGRLIIYYDLGGVTPLTVSMEVSADGGSTYETGLVGVTGDTGPSIMPGATRRIEWNAAVDGFDLDGPMIVRIVADGDDMSAGRVPAGEQFMTAHRTEIPVKRDGLLTEPAWAAATIMNDFRQREPIAGAEPTRRTTVRILYDSEAIYFGIECFDSEPEGIVHRELKRDGEIERDDNVSIALDPFNDQRTAFFFGVNPNGAKLDGEIQVSSSGSPINEDWDGVWYAASAITGDGWSTEIVIPFKTLRFPNTEVQTWRCNVRRIVARSYEEILWTGWNYNDGIDQISKYGLLTGLRDVQSGRRIEIKPFVLGGRENAEGVIDDDVKYGLDARYGITSNLTLDLTSHTDFAQVDVDREQINLTRFELNYPEKRDFFLEGRQIFSFGSSSRDAPLFYSRRIGLTADRRQVPIQAGGKLSGIVGKYEIGAVAIRTGEGYGQPAATYTVARLKRNVFSKSFVGIMAAHRMDDSDHENLTYGLDAVFRTDQFLGDKNLEFNTYAAGSVTPDASEETDMTWRAAIRYINDDLEFSTYFNQIGENYNSEMGYVPRTGIRESKHVVEFLPRTPLKFIRRLFIKPLWVVYTTDMENRLLTRNYKPTLFGFETPNNDSFMFNLNETYEYLDEDFTIFGDVVLPSGGYEWWNKQATLRTSSSRLVSCDLSSMWGDFFDGERTNFHGAVLGKLNRFVGISGDFTYNKVSLGERGSFLTREMGGKLLLNFSTRISTSMYAQYNNETNEVLFNARFHWIPKVGSDCYIVYNETLDEDDDFRSLQNTAILKINYLFRF